MALKVLDKPVDSDTEIDLVHFYCPNCYPESTVSYCGIPLNGHFEEEPADETECVVCNDIEWCPKCDGYGETDEQD